VLRFLTAGESHGRALVVVVEGLPAGLPVAAEAVSRELARRRLGYGRGPRMRFEADEITIVGGVRHGRTLGSPVAIEIANTEWPKWEEEMSPEAGQPSRRLTEPRPGHADLAGMQKYGFDDARDVLERASARETAARVAAGALAKALLGQLGVTVVSHVVQLGEARATGDRPGPDDLEAVDRSQVRCFDAADEAAMVDAVKAAAKEGDSLGGVVEVIAYGVPVGLGSHVHWDRKLDGLLAQALMSIQAVKAVEIGDGWTVAGRRGSEAHDAIHWDPAGAPTSGGYRRDTARAGGVEGGISSGAPIVLRVAMKPLATLNRPVLETVDVETKESTVSFKERTDVTAVPAMGVVAETMVALVLASEALRKFGGDSLAEVLRNRDGYLGALGETPSSATSAAARVPEPPERILLVGMMGAGKSTVGQLLARRLGWAYLDSDRQVEAVTGHTVPEIFAAQGEPAFRALETAVLQEAVGGPDPVVVSVAGGAVLDPANRALIRRSGTVVWLRARPDTLAARVGDGAGRPLLDPDPATAVRALEAVRRPYYAEVADVVVDVDELSADQVADRVLADRVPADREPTDREPGHREPAGQPGSR
jgi:chorismate synthase